MLPPIRQAALNAVLLAILHAATPWLTACTQAAEGQTTAMCEDGHMIEAEPYFQAYFSPRLFSPATFLHLTKSPKYLPDTSLRQRSLDVAVKEPNSTRLVAAADQFA